MSISINKKYSFEISINSPTILVRNHSQLDQLDYESSGHTGFASSEDFSSHTNDISNPHSVTKTQVGLENVEDGAQINIIEKVNIDGADLTPDVDKRITLPDKEPAFAKNTAFNKNFGSEENTVTQGNDARLSDARTPLSHTHGDITNEGKIGSSADRVVVTTDGGKITTASRSGIDSRSTFPPDAHNHDDMYYTESEIDTALGLKVDKVEGETLTPNKYTNDEKSKLTGIELNAEVNNISDADASGLTGGEETDLHKHAAADVNITDTGEYYDSTDVEGVLQEVGSELASIASNIEELEGPKGDKGDRGDTGPAGKSAYEVYVDGGGALTEEQWLASLKATPATYAESVEWLDENGDTSKLYLLNDDGDGYIYAFGTKEGLAPTFVNLVPISTDPSSGSIIFNEVGYKDDTYPSSTSPYYNTSVGFACSGFIPVTATDIIYFKGVTTGASHSRVGVFNTVNRSPYEAVPFASSNFYTVETLSTNYYRLTPKSAGWSGITDGFIMLSGAGIGSAMIISKTPIEYVPVAEDGFVNTGIKYNASDFSVDITALNSRVTVLENAEPPEYVSDAATALVSKILTHQNDNSFTFLSISDMHNQESNLNTANGNKHAGQAAKIVTDRIGVEFCAMLGDIVWGASGAYGEESQADIYKANEYLSEAFKGITNMRTVGNHDMLVPIDGVTGILSLSQLTTLISKYNRDMTYRHKNGYGYKDYDDYNIRVILLNTTESPWTGGLENINASQLNWFAEVLTCSDKDTPADWHTLILAHHPLDFRYVMPAANIVSAYLEGATISFTHNDESVSYDFSGKNSAEIICQVHGHLHNYKVDYIQSNRTGTLQPTTVKRICIPNACYYRNNTYKEETSTYGIWYGEEDTYDKTANGNNDTAFCVVTIDTASRKIYADHYGAGYSRVIEY